jgi:hypothetical protein
MRKLTLRPSKGVTVFAIGASAAVVATVAIAVPALAGGQAGNRLVAYVIPTTHGPLPACAEDGSNCAPANAVNEFIYVANGNSPAALAGQRVGATRADVPDAFVVSSIETDVSVNGTDTYHFIDTPPPGTNPSEFFTGFSGHWPATVTCATSAPPCNTVENPAVLPGEVTTVLYYGWTHGNGEPNGIYVFKFTVHGTFNGAPTDLTAISPPLRMTK